MFWRRVLLFASRNIVSSLIVSYIVSHAHVLKASGAREAHHGSSGKVQLIGRKSNSCEINFYESCEITLDFFRVTGIPPEFH